ncbi:MAG TPA: hypothetical protein VNW97_09080 [Candidatus Saccharimonadales bacterium]|jgi:hypothetical protein|nr:hypothetical protein [Candidatus Saccharimonadales bacterium]
MSTKQTATFLMLRQQRIKQLEEEISPLRASIANADRQGSAILLNYQHIATRHGITVQVSERTQPHPDHDQTARAHRYRWGGWACTFLGVLVFALAGSASLSFPVPQFVVFLGCAIVGLLLGIVVNTATCLLTGASASNPAASRKIALLAKISGTLALLSAAIFLLLRFVDSGMALTFVSLILVCFESSVFLLGGSLESGHALYIWSSRLTTEYQEVRAQHDTLEHRLRVAESELKELTSASIEEEHLEGDQHEENNSHQHIGSLRTNNMPDQRGAVVTVNGSGIAHDADRVGRS